MCDELQRFKYENENRLKPSWTSEEWNGRGYSAKIMLWPHSWTAAEASGTCTLWWGDTHPTLHLGGRLPPCPPAPTPLSLLEHIHNSACLSLCDPLSQDDQCVDSVSSCVHPRASGSRCTSPASLQEVTEEEEEEGEEGEEGRRRGQERPEGDLAAVAASPFSPTELR